MRTSLVFIFCCCQTLSVSAQQRTLMAGQVGDIADGRYLAGVHIINTSDSLATISDLDGVFRIPVSINDTVLYSCIGYMDRKIVVSDSLLSIPRLWIGLAPQMYRLGEVTVNPLGSKDQFRRDMMNLQLADRKLRIRGLPEAPEKSYPVWEDAEEIKKAKYLLNPVSYLYYNTNKHAKARQKYRYLTENDRMLTQARSKFDTTAVSKITGLTGTELHEFMAYCRFNDNYLLSVSAYELAETILKRYEQFIIEKDR